MSLTLRAAMVAREGTRETELQIGRGLKAWAVERHGGCQPRGRSTAIVFGTCHSDALRRASAPGRLGEEISDDVTYAEPIAVGYDEPFAKCDWPFARAVAA